VITGTHTIFYAEDAEAARAFFRDVLGLSHVDAGNGWLIFKAPPSELAVHPTEAPGTQELYLTCDDIHATVSALAAKGVEFTSEISDEGWGLLTSLKVPGRARWASTSHATPRPSTSTLSSVATLDTLGHHASTSGSDSIIHSGTTEKMILLLHVVGRVPFHHGSRRGAGHRRLHRGAARL
jgi:catechol 2,3-dioxygenase-like lactoylglutathione lyase family enzyme